MHFNCCSGVLMNRGVIIPICDISYPHDLNSPAAARCARGSTTPRREIPVGRRYIYLLVETPTCCVTFSQRTRGCSLRSGVYDPPPGNTRRPPLRLLAVERLLYYDRQKTKKMKFTFFCFYLRFNTLMAEYGQLI